MYELTLRVARNLPLTDENSWAMDLLCEDERFFDSFKPGQFLNIRLPNADHLILRRPISVHSINRSAQKITILYFVCGKGTEALSKVQAGEYISATGPIGKGFELGDAQNIWLLGGGLGCAPLYSVMQAAPDRNYRCFFGFPDDSHVFDLSTYEKKGQLILYTDDGSMGSPGFALSGLIQNLITEKPDLILACGTLNMIRALKMSLPPNVPCQVSMESRMGCGIGACLVCNCKTNSQQSQDGWMYKRVCVDGPVFGLEEVRFD